MKKLVFVIVLLALGIAAGVLGTRKFLSAEPPAGGALRVHGNVDLRDAQLAFFDEERVAEVLVEEGARVEPGELLAKLRTERLQAEIAAAEARIAAQRAAVARLENGTRPQELLQAEARLAAAEVDVANAEQVIERLRTTSASGASSAQDLDDAQASLDVARARLRIEEASLSLAREGPRTEDIAQARATLDALRAELARLHRRLADSELRAPSVGVIQSRLLEPGEMASPSRPAFTLALTDPKWIRAWVPEPELGRVALGMQARVRSDSFGGREYEGWIGFVSPVAEFTPKTVETSELRTRLVYELRVFVEDPADELRLGMPVTVDIDPSGGTDHAPAGEAQ
jgi:HlyD family secretion protein